MHRLKLFAFHWMKWSMFCLISFQRRFSRLSSICFGQRETLALTCLTLIGQIQCQHCHVVSQMQFILTHTCIFFMCDSCWHHHCCYDLSLTKPCLDCVFSSRFVLNVPNSLFQLEESEWALEPFFGVMGGGCDLPAPCMLPEVAWFVTQHDKRLTMKQKPYIGTKILYRYVIFYL